MSDIKTGPPVKVVITITAYGEQVDVFAYGGKLIASRSARMIGPELMKEAKCGDFYDDLPNYEDVASALIEATMSTFDIVAALKKAES